MTSEDFEIFLDDLSIYLDTQMAALNHLKERIHKLAGSGTLSGDGEKWLWDPQKIKWEKTKGAKGEYERYPLENCRIEISTDYKNLLQDLKEQKCFLYRDGFNYWLFRDLATVGRKKKEVTT